jgi:hypothetical protein
MPQLNAISLKGARVESMRDWATSTRRRPIQALADVPKVSLKARQKWLVLMPSKVARSLMQI